jgi:MFS family permease
MPADPGSDEAADTIRAPRAGWGALAIFVVLYAVAYIDRQIITLMVDPIRHDLGISDFQISILQGAAFVVLYSLVALPIGFLVDRYQRRWIIFAGVIVWSFGAVASGLSRTYGHMLATRAVVGAGEATLSPSVYSMLSDIFPRERLASAMSIYTTGAMAGTAISFIAAGYIIALATTISAHQLPFVGSLAPWQLVFVVTGAPGLILAFTIFLIREPARRGKIDDEWIKRRGSIAALRDFLRGRGRFYVAHIMGFSLFAIVTTGFAAWAPTYLIRTFHWPVERVGLTLGLVTLTAGVAGPVAVGWFTDYLFRRGVRDAHLRIYVWGTLVVGALAIVATLSRSVPVVIAAIWLEKAIVSFIGIAAAALQITTPNQFRGQISAIFLFFYNIIGIGIGATMIAAISDFGLGGPAHIGAAIAIAFAIVCPIASMLLAYGLAPMRRAVDSAQSWTAD